MGEVLWGYLFCVDLVFVFVSWVCCWWEVELMMVEFLCGDYVFKEDLLKMVVVGLCVEF